MNFRRLGRTGLMVSEIGLGGEWLERHDAAECRAVIDRCAEKGINILDCWMSEPNVRSNIGAAIKGSRGRWFIQGHIGSTWQNGQYVRSREDGAVRAAFEDLLARLGTDYVDLGMIHYIDSEKEFRLAMEGSFLEYVRALKKSGAVRFVGLSTHNPAIARLAALSGEVDMLLFSVNPAFDMLPPSEDLDDSFAESYDEALGGIAPERAGLYRLCESLDIGVTVMKGFAGGRLLKADSSPFGVALTPAQCIHYALTRPAVSSVLVGCETVEQVDRAVSYEEASPEERDYASVLASAPRHAYRGQCTYCGHCKPCPMNIDIAMVNKLYDLAAMQEEAPSSVRAHYEALEQNASACIGCRSCEARCPFGVKVAQRMREAARLFAR